MIKKNEIKNIISLDSDDDNNPNMQTTDISTKNNLCFITCKDKKPLYSGWANMSRLELNEKFKDTYNKKYNKGLITGFLDNEDYGIVGLDIDDVDEFKKFIKDNKLNKKEITNTLSDSTIMPVF
jgi:hypothetical protein